MEGKAYLLRPDIPKEGKVRRLKSGETEGGELSDPLKSYADEAGLIMRRSTLTPYTTYALAATEFAKLPVLAQPTVLNPKRLARALLTATTRSLKERVGAQTPSYLT